MDLHIIQKDWLTLKYLVTSISLNMNEARCLFVCMCEPVCVNRARAIENERENCE